MIWERDYMKRRSGAECNSGASDTIQTEGSASDPVDIFAGVQRQPLSSQDPTARASDDSKSGNSVSNLDSTVPLAADQSELPLNRLLAKYPRFLCYATIVILGIIISILLGRKL
jgi:hypothetical protein